MLVLSRRKNEKIIIGDSITVMVIQIGNGKVRLGVEAPKDMTVHREEIYEAIKQERKQAAGNGARVADVGDGLASEASPSR